MPTGRVSPPRSATVPAPSAHWAASEAAPGAFSAHPVPTRSLPASWHAAHPVDGASAWSYPNAPRPPPGCAWQAVQVAPLGTAGWARLLRPAWVVAAFDAGGCAMVKPPTLIDAGAPAAWCQSGAAAVPVPGHE